MLVEMRNMRAIVWKNNTTVQIQINTEWSFKQDIPDVNSPKYNITLRAVGGYFGYI